MPTTPMQKIDFSTLAASEPSLVLPYVYTSVSSEHIASTFEELGLGEIDRIERLEKTNTRTGKPFDVVFVHFTAWNTSSSANCARLSLLNKREAKIYYDGHWFWKARAYVAKVKTPPPAAPKARIEFSEPPAEAPAEPPAEPPAELKGDSATGFKWTPSVTD